MLNTGLELTTQDHDLLTGPTSRPCNMTFTIGILSWGGGLRAMCGGGMLCVVVGCSQSPTHHFIIYDLFSRT